MGSRCSCGSEVTYAFHHFGCVQCGGPCCPGCASHIESASYCARCVESLFDLPARPALDPIWT
jgi:hypothetical protein